MDKSVKRVGVSCVFALVLVCALLNTMQTLAHRYAVGFIGNAEYSTGMTTTILAIVSVLIITIFRVYRIIKDSEN